MNCLVARRAKPAHSFIRAMLTLTALLYMTTAMAAQFSYDNCILSDMKGVSSDLAAQSIKSACENKRNTAEKESQLVLEKKYGKELSFDNASSLLASQFEGSRSTGYAISFTNKTDKLVTIIGLLIQDEQYDKYVSSTDNSKDTNKRAIGTSRSYLDDALAASSEGEEREAWKKKHSRRLVYKAHVFPSEEIKLKLISPMRLHWFT